MNTCPRCGAPMQPQSNEKTVCEFCGDTVLTKRESPKRENAAHEQPAIRQEVDRVSGENSDNAEDALGCLMWGVCFLIPIIGIILFFKYKSEGYFVKSNSALTAAIVSIVIGFIFSLS